MALSRDIVLRLLGDSSSAQKALKDAANAADVSVSAYRSAEREQARQTSAMQKASAAQSAAHKQLGIAAIAMGAAIGLGLGVAVKAAIDWESAFAGVAKTVEGTPEQMAALEQSLRGLALILPVTHQELAAVAEAAGQLGVAREDIAAFTATAIALGETTNLSATDAATALAQLSNVMGTSADDTSRLGSALVELGNNGASTEADILQMAQRIAGAGTIIGLTEGEVLGFAAALANVGIEAQAGGSAISKVMIEIATSVDAGGEKLEQFAAVAGVSAQEFARMFRDDAAGAIAAFVTGLGQIDEAGGSTFQTLEQLGFSEVRVRDALLRLSAGADGLTAALAMGNSAWEENSALLEEAAKRYATTEAQLEMARNALVDAAIDIGNTLIPVLLSLSQVLQGLIGWWQDLPGPVQDVVVALAAVAAVGLVAGGGLTVAKLAMANFTATTVAAGGAVSRFGVLARGAFAFMGGPWGIALAAAAIGIGALAKESGEAEGRVRELTAAIEADSGALGDNVRTTLIAQASKEGLLAAADELGISMVDLIGALMGEEDALARVNVVLAEHADEINAAGLGMNDAGEAAALLGGALEGTNGELTEAQEAYRLQKEALGESTDATDDQTAATEGLGGAMSETASETETLSDRVDKLREAFDELNGINISSIEANIGLQDALVGVQERIQGAKDGTDGYALSLDTNTDAGRRNMESLIDVAEAAMKVYEADLAAGVSSDVLTAGMNTTRESLFNTAMQMGLTTDEAWALVDSILSVPPNVPVTVYEYGFDAAIEKARLLAAAINGIPNYKNVTYTSSGSGLAQVYGNAFGGLIPGTSPGPRADDKMTRITSGEFVQPVDATEYYGVPFMEAVRTKRFPRGGFAEGGLAYGGSIGVSMASGGQVSPGGSSPVVNVVMPDGPMWIVGTLDLGDGLEGRIDGRIQFSDGVKRVARRAKQRTAR